jgi:hypothetical protein
MVIVSFANPIHTKVAPPGSGSSDRHGKPTRWMVTGNDLSDLSLSPSIDVGDPACWHGFITGGVVSG